MIVFTTALGILLAPVAHADPAIDPNAPQPVPVAQDAAQVAPAPLSVQDVVAANGIANPNLIFPGEIIQLPGRDSYTVAKGDTLSRIVGGPPPVVLVSAISVPSPAPAPTPDGGAAVQPAVMTTPAVHQSVNWDAVAKCESGDNWAINTGNGFHGGLQFTLSTWHSNGGSGMPESAGRDEQIRVAENVLHSQGIGAWPVCGRRG